MKRPTLNDEAVIRIAAEKLLPAVKEWLSRSGDESDDEDTLKDLCRALRWESDGYEIAKHLESDSWMPGAALVEILDDAISYKMQARDAACLEWMKTSGLIAPVIGARVRCPARPTLGAGTVAANDDMGRALVKFENQISKAHLGHWIEWEWLTPAEEAP